MVAMSRSIPGHRIQNWCFKYALWRKLRLPIYDPQEQPRCWCGETHDAYGDHAFSCVQNNKKMTSNFIRDGWALALQPALATCGYIRQSSKLETEKLNLCDAAPGVNPLDLSFNPDPDPDPHIATPCRFPTVGMTSS